MMLRKVLFACAVAGNDAGLVALLESEAYVAEEQAVAVALCEVFDVEYVGHVSKVKSRASTWGAAR